jgi:hypothetical protein
MKCKFTIKRRKRVNFHQICIYIYSNSEIKICWRIISHIWMLHGTSDLWTRCPITLYGRSCVCILICLTRSEGFLNSLVQYEHWCHRTVPTRRCRMMYLLYSRNKNRNTYTMYKWHKLWPKSFRTYKVGKQRLKKNTEINFFKNLLLKNLF